MTDADIVHFSGRVAQFVTHRMLPALTREDVQQEMILHYLETEGRCAHLWHCYSIARDRLDPRSRLDASRVRMRRSARQRDITPQQLQATARPVDLYLSLDRQPAPRRLVLILAHLYGFSLAELATMLDRHPSTIADWSGGYRLTVLYKRQRSQRRHVTEDHRYRGQRRTVTPRVSRHVDLTPQMQAMRAQGDSIHAIAKALGVSRWTVGRLLKHARGGVQ